MRKLTYWLAGLVLIGVAIGAVLLLNNIQEITWPAAQNAVCEATVADFGGVDISSAFRFTFEDDVSANAVRRFLSVEPAIQFNFHQGLQAREVLAVPVAPLEPDTLYHFSLTTQRGPLCWVFQTRREERAPGDPAARDIWQYLALSKERYGSGDTVDFWGYMRRRDNTDWEWSRVSVYVYAQGDGEEPVAQGYAPLANNMFYGGIELPRLLDGLYELQIWQSGQMLVARPFAVGAAPAPAAVTEAQGLGEAGAPALNVFIKGNSPPVGERILEFKVVDMAGAAPAKAGLLVSVASPEGETLFFGDLPLDNNGRAELTLSLPPGSWRVQARAMADAAPPLFGSATLSLTVAGEATPLPPAPPVTQPQYQHRTAWASRYDMSADASHLLREGLLFFSSGERVQAMELLWQNLFTLPDSGEEQLNLATAHLLCQRYGYACLALPPAPALDVQRADGGLSAGEDKQSELLLSMLGAVAARQGLTELDTFALARYLRGQASQTALLTERALALAGLAALDRPVLQEIKLLLPETAELPEANAALICGLALAGDTQVAKAALHDFLAAYATDATFGGFYLEGGQGENIRLNRLTALAAGTIGEAHTAFSLLQYLQNQQGRHDVVTVMTVGGLLQSLYISPCSATLNLNNRPYTVELSAFADQWLNQPTPGDLLVEKVEGDVAMTCLRLM